MNEEEREGKISKYRPRFLRDIPLKEIIAHSFPKIISCPYCLEKYDTNLIVQNAVDEHGCGICRWDSPTPHYLNL